MNKLLTKATKLLLGLSLAAGVGVAIGSKVAERVDAASTTFTCGTDTSTSTSLSKDNITLSFESGGGVWNRTDNYRLYANKKLTISSPNTITKVEFTISQNDFSLYSGGGSYTNKTWTGSSTSIVFSCTAQVRFTPVVVTYSAVTTHNLTYDAGLYGAHDGSTTKVFALAENTGTQTVKSPADVGITPNSGYEFLNWNTASDGSGTNYSVGSSFTMGTTNVTLFAQYEAEQLNNEIVFGDNGTESTSEASAEAIKNYIISGKGYVSSISGQSKVYKANPGLKIGSGSAVGTFTINFDTTKTSSLNGLTLYAEIGDYGTDGGNFTFTSSQLSGSPVSVAKPSSLTKTAIASFTSAPASLTIATSTKRGYLESLSFETPSGYTVSFNAGDGSGSMSSILDVSGSYTLPNCTFTAPEGYEFAGWKANNAGEVISAGGTYNVSANVTFYAQWSEIVVQTYNFRKITKIAELNTSQVGGGRYVISNSENNAMVMSTTQNTNNRANTTATVENDEIVVTTPTTVAILNIEKTGDYYTIFDSANEGYLYGVSGSNHLKTSNPQTKTDYYYWSISFSGGHAVFTNKGSSYVIRVNTGNNPPIFSTYNGTQTAVDLYELDSDIPVSVALSSITASNSSVQVGSTITYSGTYSPANATEGIVIATLDTTYATAGDVSMSAGTFTVSITGVATTAGTSLEFEGEEGHGSASVTLVVVAYTATHDLVTGASSLSNGSRIVIACTDAEFNYIAEHSTGASNLNGVTTGFADDKSTLAATASQEFVVWCVDSVNGYYVFSDGDYFLASPTSKNNYLERTDVLSERCYFTITDDANGVSISNSYGVNHSWKDVSSAYTIYFNNTTSKFSLYANAQKSTSLYVSKQSVDSVQGFIDVFMHMNAYAANNGYCSDNDHHYYTDAKAAFTNQLNASQREAFCTQSAYASAYARLSSWADNNGDKIDASYSLVQKSNAKLLGFGSYNENTNTIAIIVIISMVSVTAIGGYFFIKRRKVN